MNRFLNALIVGCLISNLANMGMMAYAMSHIRQMRSQLPPEVQVKVVNAREPFLATLTIQREVTYGGDQIATKFVGSIRDKSYVVENNLDHYVLYSHHLQQLLPGTKVRAWFQWTDANARFPEGELPFVVPLELISLEGPLR